MIFSSSSRVSSALVTMLAICIMGCASNNRPLMVAIHASRDSVPLVSNPQGLSFSVPVVVQNNESRAVAITGCGPAAERQIDGKWTIVFSPVCMQEQRWQVNAGDSAVIPVLLYGYSAAGMLPKLDPRALPGTYRLVFDVSAADGPAGQMSAPPDSRKVASAPFILTN